MPELPEVEAWRAQLDPRSRAFADREGRPGAHRDAEDLRAAARGARRRRFAGAERRGKRLLFPTDDGELVLLVHLMSAGRLRYLAPGAKGPKTPAFRARVRDGGELVLTEGGEEEARRRLAPHAGGSRGRARPPRPGGARPRRRAARARSSRARSRRLHSLLRDQRVIAGSAAPGRTRSSTREALAVRALDAARDDEVERSPRRSTRSSTRGLELREEGPKDDERPTASTAGSASRATLRHAARPRRLRGAHDLLLPELPDRRAGAQGPPAVAPAQVSGRSPKRATPSLAPQRRL